MSRKFINILLLLCMLPIFLRSENLIELYNNSICVLIAHCKDDSTPCIDYQIDSIIKGELPKGYSLSNVYSHDNIPCIFFIECRGPLRNAYNTFYYFDNSDVKALLNDISINGPYEICLPYQDTIIGLLNDRVPSGTWNFNKSIERNTYQTYTMYEYGVPVLSKYIESVKRDKNVNIRSTQIRTYNSGCLMHEIMTTPDADCIEETWYDSTTYRSISNKCTGVNTTSITAYDFRGRIKEQICQDEQIVETTELIPNLDSSRLGKPRYVNYKNTIYNNDNSLIEYIIVWDRKRRLQYYESIKYYNNKSQLVEHIAYIPFTSENFTILFFKDSLSNTLIENGTGYYYSNKLIFGSREADEYDYCSGNFKDSVKVGTWIFCDYKKCEKREYIDGVIISTENCDTCISPARRSVTLRRN